MGPKRSQKLAHTLFSSLHKHVPCQEDTSETLYLIPISIILKQISAGLHNITFIVHWPLLLPPSLRAELFQQKIPSKIPSTAANTQLEWTNTVFCTGTHYRQLPLSCVWSWFKCPQSPNQTKNLGPRFISTSKIASAAQKIRVKVKVKVLWAVFYNMEATLTCSNMWPVSPWALLPWE